MAVYIYKVFMAYHDDKDKVKNFIENHDGGSWYFIHKRKILVLTISPMRI